MAFLLVESLCLDPLANRCIQSISVGNGQCREAQLTTAHKKIPNRRGTPLKAER